MKGLPLSRAASGLLRALLQRTGEDKHRILLTGIRSTDWQSLTFTGERHVLVLRFVGDQPEALARRLTGGLAEAEFNIPGHIVADIAAGPGVAGENGSVMVVIEALTISE